MAEEKSLFIVGFGTWENGAFFRGYYSNRKRLLEEGIQRLIAEETNVPFDDWEIEHRKLNAGNINKFLKNQGEVVRIFPKESIRGQDDDFPLIIITQRVMNQLFAQLTQESEEDEF